MSATSPPAGPFPDGVSLAAQMRPALVSYFRRKTGNAAEAEDLAQEVIVRALARIDWTSPAHAKGYMFRTAVNVWRDRRRRQRTQGVVVAWDETTARETGAENSPERVLIDREELNRVVQALRELDPRARTALMLVKLENMKVANVAMALGVSVRTVAKDLAKAAALLARLRDAAER